MAAIAALVVIIVFALGGIVKEVFQDTCDKIKSQGGATISGDCS